MPSAKPSGFASACSTPPQVRLPVVHLLTPKRARFPRNAEGMSLCSAQLARRAPWTCLSCTSLTRTSQNLIASSTNHSAARTHQRKHSSSKASNSPKDDTRAIANPTEAPNKDAKPASKKGTEKRPSTRTSRQRSKDGTLEAGKLSNELGSNLPSVPPTNHLHQAGTSLDEL